MEEKYYKSKREISLQTIDKETVILNIQEYVKNDENLSTILKNCNIEIVLCIYKK